MSTRSEHIFQEWLECRRTIARFDDYLLRVRTLGFSVFALLFTGIAGLAGSTVSVQALSPEALLFALLTLSIYVGAIYVLDRYYERMLLVAVLRASRLEALSLEGFRVGLTTEIHFQKERIHMKRKLVWKASHMVNGVYVLIFLSMWAQYYIVATKLGTHQDGFLLLLGGMIIGVFGIIFMAHRELSEPNHLINERAEVVNSPVVMSTMEISNAVARIAGEVREWMKESGASELHVVSIIFGARPFTEDFVAAVEKLDGVRCHVHPVHMEATREDKLLDNAFHKYGRLRPGSLIGKHVVILDDLVDSGSTLKAVLGMVAEAGPKAVRTAVLINKYLNVPVKADHVGLDLGLDKKFLTDNGIDDYWLVGYGMDSGSSYRELAHVGWITKKTA